MGYYKRTHRFMGPLPLLEKRDREYKTLWLQPTDESQVPIQVRAYEDADGWNGFRYTHMNGVECLWMRQLWKEVPSPFGELDSSPVNDDDNEPTEEIPT